VLNQVQHDVVFTKSEPILSRARVEITTAPW
jgi:hypothetical protein